MAIYSYRALSDRGRAIQGQLTAGNEHELYHLLREQGFELVSCKSREQKRGLLSFGGSITGRMIIQLCVQLEQMLRAGIPLREALRELRDNAPSSRLQDILSEIYRDVGEGKSLSEAFGRHPRVFGTVFVTLLEAGEQTGRLEEALGRLNTHLGWSEEMVSRTKKAVRYPAFMGLMVIGVTSFMMAFVVPQVVAFLQSNGKELPAMTVALIATSGVFLNYWWLLLGVPLVAVAGIAVARRTSPRAALAFDRLVLHVPRIGIILRYLDLARFAHMLAIMYRTGIPILQALGICSRLVRNRSIKEAVEIINEQISSGQSLSRAMGQSGIFPTIAVRMIAVGETSGDLDRMLEMIAGELDRETDDSIQALIGTIEPALTLIMGGMMGWIAMAVFGPIYDNLSQLGI
ncbi:MAG: type II secretion system F family protein [Geminicoccaceae bacterium]|nr:type II secretion system F family protein [Geminicoccaceae bacterium]